MLLKPSEFQYVVLPGRFCPEKFVHIYDQAYRFWHDNWTAVYKQLKANKEAHPDDFFRQDFIPVILHQDRVIAIHLYTLFDLRPECGIEHSYLKHNFNSDYFASLRKMKIRKVMSMESLFVNSDYRKSKTGVQIAEVLSSLGQRVFLKCTDAEALIAPARIDLKVSEMGCAIGFEHVQSNIELNNVPVDLLICKRDKVVPPKSETIRFFVEHLWRNHVNLTKTILEPKAA